MRNFPFFKQLNAMDCGPTCLRMVAGFYGRTIDPAELKEQAGYSRSGTSMLGLQEAAESLGFTASGVQLSLRELEESPSPCILHVDQSHFIVLVRLKPAGPFRSQPSAIIADPSSGILTIPSNHLLQRWGARLSGEQEPLGTALFLHPGPAFHSGTPVSPKRLGWKTLLDQLKQSRRSIAYVFLTLLAASILQLIIPFITQNVVDVGIKGKNLSYITLILAGQAMLAFSLTTADFIRSRILFRLSIRLNRSILAGFWAKLTRLPLSYFDQHRTGDTIQRLSDNKQIQDFITGNAITTVFSLCTFFIFSAILAWYNAALFGVVLLGAIGYMLWIRTFIRIRRKINFQTFHLAAKENAATLQLVQGMQELRLQNAQDDKRAEWEEIQSAIFGLNYRSLLYGQYQQSGALLIRYGKDIAITFLVAELVIHNQLTFGAMLSIQYIIGQLNSPIEQLVSFFQRAQDARISMERLNEVHSMRDEEPAGIPFLQELPAERTIRFQNFSFAYPGAGNDPVLHDIQLEIPEGKVTALVGVSGSGKTTLLKILLKFYGQYEGEICIGDIDYKDISPSFWRSKCGAVMHDGYIFNDSIARNIAVAERSPEPARLIHACTVANLLGFIDSLPNGFDTLIGSDGQGLSQGQKQRLLIARAVYRDPHYLFFDEATNALDANNEKEIVQRLRHIMKGRTVLIIAHRLSTVREADNIVVLDKGRIVEQGTHASLSDKKGLYYQLVRNQLQL